MPATPLIKLDAYNELIVALYAGTTEAQPWQSFLACIRHQLDASASLLILRKPSETDPGVMVFDNLKLPDVNTNIYSGEFYQQDPFVNLPSGIVKTLDEYIPIEQFKLSEFYKVCLAPYGMLHTLGIDFHLDDGLQASFRLLRAQHSPGFSDADKALCQLLSRHLEQAISLHAKLERISAESSLYATAINQLSLATVILDENGDILSTNPIADALLKQRDGIQANAQTLTLCRAPANRQLRALIKQSIEEQRSKQPGIARAMAIERPSGKRPLGLVLRPVPSSQWGEGQRAPCVAIFISDPELPATAPRELLTELFELTPAESGLAIALANGLSLDEAVDDLGISRNTGRAHLRAIFSKTAVSQQSQLVRLVLKSVANLA